MKKNIIREYERTRFVKHEKFKVKSQFRQHGGSFLVTVEYLHSVVYAWNHNHRVLIMRLHVIDLGWVEYVTLRYVVSAGTGRLHLWDLRKLCLPIVYNGLSATITLQLDSRVPILQNSAYKLMKYLLKHETTKHETGNFRCGWMNARRSADE